MNIDDNIKLSEDGHATQCGHCGEPLGSAGEAPLARALVRERPSRAAGPGIHADPRHFTDRPIVLRQTLCPKCLALLATEIVPQDEAGGRGWKLLNK